MQHRRRTVAPGVRSTAKPDVWELRWEGERGLNGQRVEKGTKFTGTLREARRQRNRLAADDRGAFEWDRLTLKDAGTRWLSRLPDSTWGQITAPWYWGNHILPTLGRQRVGGLKQSHIVAFMDEVKDRKRRDTGKALSRGTIRTILGVLRQFFRYGSAYGLIATDPTLVVPIWLKQLRDAPPSIERRSLEDEEVGRLLEAATGTEIEVAVYLGAFVGMRPSEVIGLRWIDVDLQHRTLRVVHVEEAAMHRFKGPKSAAGGRIVAIERELVAALKRQQLRQHRAAEAAGDKWIDSGHVLTRPDGRPFYYDRLNDRFGKIRASARVDCVYYEFRHTYASVADADPNHKKRRKAIAQQMGHAGGAPLPTYVHPLVSGSRRAAKAVAKHARRGMRKSRNRGQNADSHDAATHESA